MSTFCWGTEENLMKRISLIVATLGVVSSAFAVDVTAIDGSQGWFGNGFSGGGTATLVASPTNDGDGSLQMTGDRSRVNLDGGQSGFGTLGALAAGNIQADLYRDGASTGTAHYQIAIGLYVRNAANQTGSITWEGAYNGYVSGMDDTWLNDVIMGGTGQWWIRSGGWSYDQVANMKSLLDWTGGSTVTDSGNTSIALGLDTVITGIEFKVGSGVPGGTFIGNIDDFQIAFDGGFSETYNFQAVPEPMTMSVLGLGAAALIRKRRRNK